MSEEKGILVDVRGSLCPKPVIETKKVSDAHPEDVITTIVDNEVSRDNVEKFGISRGYGVTVVKDGADFYITMIPGVQPAGGIPKNGDAYGNRVILMTKDYLGEGSEELGRNLMKTFWNCMVEADIKPVKIYFINSSVKMVVDGSVHLDNLKALENQGVEILACGICLDYFGVKDTLSVGAVTNMYAITDALIGENLVKL